LNAPVVGDVLTVVDKTVEAPPTFKFSTIPTPPRAMIDPVVAVVLVVVFFTSNPEAS
jgi:hypothetical protein